MHYTVSTIIEGALESDETHTQGSLDRYVAALEIWAIEHPDSVVEVFAVPHEHEEGIECECVQYLTDHHPYKSFNS